MMLTEEQAKEKWCPFARVSMLPKDGDVQPSNNRVAALRGGEMAYDAFHGTECLASQCMAWRFGPTLQSTVIEARELPDGEWVSFGWDPRTYRFERPDQREWYMDRYEFRDLAPENRKGHCGLAGQVQP